MARTKIKRVSEFENVIKARIERLLEKKYGSVMRFSKVKKFPYQTIQKALLNYQHMNLTHLGKIMEALDGNYAAIFGDESFTPVRNLPSLENEYGRGKMVPILPPTACGEPTTKDTDVIGWHLVGSEYISHFDNPALTKAVGDCMAPTIIDGDMVMIDRSPLRRIEINKSSIYLVNSAPPGSTPIVSIKRVVISGDSMFFIPQNSLFQVERISYSKDEILNHILGEIVWIGRRLNVNSYADSQSVSQG